MITLYAAYNFDPVVKGLVRDFRVRWALEALALPYDCRWVDIKKNEQRGAPNTLINPFGKLPSLENGALRMFESGAIVLYLYEHAGKAPQDAHARAELNQWCFAALSTVEPVFHELFRWDVFWKDKPGYEWRRAEVLGHVRDRLAALERALGTKHYLLGNDCGPADILMTTVLDFARHDAAIIADYPNVRAYLERCHAQPGYVRALAKHGEGPKANAA